MSDRPRAPNVPSVIHYRPIISDVTTRATHMRSENMSVDLVSGYSSDFVVKSRVLSDLANEPLKHPYSFGVVLVMSALFLLFILLVTATLLVFCRKKNTVFAVTAHAPLCKANDFRRYRYTSADDVTSAREAYELEACSNVFSESDNSTADNDDNRTETTQSRKQQLQSDAHSESAVLLPESPTRAGSSSREARLSLPLVTNFLDLLTYADDSGDDSDVSCDSAYCTQQCLDESRENVYPPNLTQLFLARSQTADVDAVTSPSVAIVIQDVGIDNETFESAVCDVKTKNMSSSEKGESC